MHVRRKRTSEFQSVIDAASDPKRRRELAEQASEAAARIASDVAKKSAEVGSIVGERVSEAAEAARQSDAPARIATDVAKRSRKLRSHVAEMASEVAHAAAEEGDDLVKQHEKNRKAKKPRRHRLRNAAIFTGAGAVAAYFLDPENGTRRREAARSRTSSSAQAVGDGLDRAAHAAHQAADATGMPGEQIASQATP